MRRSASNTGRLCSPASDSMCAHSPASSALAGWTRSPRGLEQRRRRRLREPVDLEARAAGGAARARSRDRAARARGRSATRRRARAAGARRARRQVGGGDGGSRNSRSSRLTRTGSRALGEWPLPSSVTSRPPVSAASSAPSACTADAIVVAVDHEHGAAHAARQLARLAPRSSFGASTVLDEELAGRARSPIRGRVSICRVECGSGNISPKNHSAEALEVAPPGMPVVARPSPRTRAARRRSRL